MKKQKNAQGKNTCQLDSPSRRCALANSSLNDLSLDARFSSVN